MFEIPPAIMESLWALLLALVAAVIAYLEKSKKDEIIAFMDPTDTTTLSAPEGLPAVTYTMGTEEKAKILAGKSAADTQAILQQIATAEAEKLATYTITYQGGSYEIEYGYVKQSIIADATRPPRKVDEETFRWLMAGLPESEAASVRAQVDAAEAQGLRQFTVTTSRWVYIIDNGLIADSKGP
jgi:hypothetical protein